MALTLRIVCTAVIVICACATYSSAETSTASKFTRFWNVLSKIKTDLSSRSDEDEGIYVIMGLICLALILLPLFLLPLLSMGFAGNNGLNGLNGLNGFGGGLTGVNGLPTNSLSVTGRRKRSVLGVPTSTMEKLKMEFEHLLDSLNKYS